MLDIFNLTTEDMIGYYGIQFFGFFIVSIILAVIYENNDINSSNNEYGAGELYTPMNPMNIFKWWYDETKLNVFWCWVLTLMWGSFIIPFTTWLWLNILPAKILIKTITSNWLGRSMTFIFIRRENKIKTTEEVIQTVNASGNALKDDIVYSEKVSNSKTNNKKKNSDLNLKKNIDSNTDDTCCE